MTTAVEENCRLAKEREVTEKETYAVTELLRQELRDKTVAVQKLEEQIVEVVNPKSDISKRPFLDTS